MWITPSGERKMPSDAYVSRIIKNPGDYHVVERLPLDKDSIPVAFKGLGEPVKHLVILSYVLITREQHAETHSLAVVDSNVPWEHKDEKLVEIGIVRCGVDASNRLCSVDEAFNALIWPGFDVPAEFTKVTGIANDMLRGTRFDKTRSVHSGTRPDYKGTGLGKDVFGSTLIHIMRGAYVAIILSDEYTNPLRFLDYEIQQKCTHDGNDIRVRTISEYDWKGRFGTDNLAVLLEREGFFFDGTPAYMRCLAAALLLHRVPESMHELHEKHEGI